MPYRRRGCRKHFSVMSRTLMHASKLGAQTWLLAIFLIVANPKGRSSVQLAADLGVTQQTAWHLAHRIRETVTQYFLAQRIKLPDESDSAAVEAYRDQLARLHKLLVHAMKSKQTTDLAHPAALRETLKAFREAYES